MVESESLVGDSKSFIFQAWAAFALAVVAMAWGIWSLPVDPWMRAFLGIGYLFTVSSCLTLAKAVRDQHEHRRLVNRVSSAATEKILREHEQSRAA